MSTERVETLVIGAGIAGLAYAHARGEGADLLVLEASERAGGLIRTLTTPSGHVELGPEALQDNAPEVTDLFAELDLAPLPSRAAAARRFVLHDGDELVALPSGPGSLFKSPLLSLPAKLRLFTEPFRRRDVGLDGSVSELLNHRLGKQLVERFVDPFISGVYAGDPELVSARAAFPAIVEMVEKHGSLFGGMKAKMKAARAKRESETAAESAKTGAVGEGGTGAAGGKSGAGEKGGAAAKKRGMPALLSASGGLERLPEAIAASLGDRLRLESPVEALERDADGWRAQVGGTTIIAERLVLATSAPASARLLEKAAPALSQELASLQAEGVVSIAQLWRREDLGHPLDGFGYLVRSSLGKRHLGTLFSSSISEGRCDEHHVLLRTLIGGARHPELLDASDDELRAIVTDEVAPVLKAQPDALPDWHHIQRWPKVLPRYDLQHPRRCAAIESEQERLANVHLLGNHRRGISVNALITTSRELAREHAANEASAGA